MYIQFVYFTVNSKNKALFFNNWRIWNLAKECFSYFLWWKKINLSCLNFWRSKKIKLIFVFFKFFELKKKSYWNVIEPLLAWIIGDMFLELFNAWKNPINFFHTLWLGKNQIFFRVLAWKRWNPYSGSFFVLDQKTSIHVFCVTVVNLD